MNPVLMNNIILRWIFYWFASFCLFIMGWKIKGKMPDIKKFVLIAAPHSSNWDFVFFLLVIFKFKISIHWMGKHTLFKWPFKWILKQLGGISVYRSKKGNVVNALTLLFNRSKEMIITIAPSGTRKKVTEWKTGFYHIASQSKVPIVLGFIDYNRKIAGIGPVFNPSGDIDADMKTIRSFYTPFSGRYPTVPSNQ